MVTKLSPKAKLAIVIAILIAVAIILGGVSQTAQFTKFYNASNITNKTISNITNKTIIPISTLGRCNDTDGGFNLQVSGICYSLSNNGTDTCISNTTIKEWFCTASTGVCASNQTICSTNQTCNSGRCI